MIFNLQALPISQVRANLPTLVAQSQIRPTAITVNGSPKAAIIDYEELASLVATLDTMSDPELMEGIKRSEADIKAGRVVSWEDLKKELGLE